jgi:hypothetical protein
VPWYAGALVTSLLWLRRNDPEILVRCVEETEQGGAGLLVAVGGDAVEPFQSMETVLSQAFGPLTRMARESKAWSTVSAMAMSGLVASILVLARFPRSSAAPCKKKLRHGPFSAPSPSEL